jgi:ketosteroid isomerase-like protein
VRAGYDAFNCRDLNGILALLSDDIEFRMPLDPMGMHPVFRGRDGVTRFYARVWEGFDEIRLEVASISELAGDVLVVTGHVVARPPGAEPTTFGFSHFWKFIDGRAVAVSFHDAVNPLSLLESPEQATAAGEEGSLQ